MNYEENSLKARPPVNTFEYENREAINEYPRQGFLGIIVDTSKAIWQGEKWKKLSKYSKRKWENMLVLAYAKTRIKITYY